MLFGLYSICDFMELKINSELTGKLIYFLPGQHELRKGKLGFLTGGYK